MKYKILLLAAGLIGIVSVLSAFDTPTPAPPPPPSTYYHKEYTGTITNTSKDTILVPTTLYSNFAGLFQVVRTNTSGTTNVALKIESSNMTSGNSDWVSVATGSGTGATTEALTFVDMFGLRYRIILTGTGTQVTPYLMNLTLKKKYVL